jgi:hypothetical protein
MKKPKSSRIALLLLALGLAAGPASAAAIHGALFTTDVAGTVNVNQYELKTDVYLSGGPGPNAPCTAADLDDGVYVYQVTNPSGTVVLSSDGVGRSPIGVREFTVVDHVITATTNHNSVVVPPAECGGLRVQVAPFDDTPNNGGEYKLWITRKSDYEANGSFKPGSIKTDNFKVKVPVVGPELSGVLVYKFYDANGNGVWDSEEVPLFGWPMTVANGNGFNSTAPTLSPDGLVTFSDLPVADNPYSVGEASGGPRWVQSASIVNGVPTNTPQATITGLNLVANETTQVDFGNYCTCIVKPYPISYWVGAAGQTKLNDGLGMNSEFSLLKNANLRSAAGGQFNFNLLLPESDNYNTLSAWLLGAGSTTNVAYSLSAQLAVLKLNLEAGFVKGTLFDKAYGGTVAQLVADANLLLSNTVCGTSCNTTTASQLGADQDALRAFIEDINDGAVLIQPKACATKFVAPPA